MQLMNIGDAAATAGVTPKMIRHYEALGLIPEAARTEAGYRLYGEREISMLRFIRQSRSLGFSMQQIESLLALWRDPARHSREVKQLAVGQLTQLQERQRELDQMRSTLEQVVAQCRGDDSTHCVILDQLAKAAAPALPAGLKRAQRALKVVRPGERREHPAKPRAKTEDGASGSAHAVLFAAWGRSPTQAA